MSSVAVCIPTIPTRYQLLKRALKSVYAQTKQPNEVIVELDTVGAGAGPTRNKAWQKASSDFIAFLDDDDEFEPEHLELCMKFLRREGADLAYPWFTLYDAEGNPQAKDPLAVPHNGLLRSPYKVKFGPEQAAHCRSYAFIPATVVVRRSALERVGGYPDHDSEEYEKYGKCEDWALLNRLLDVRAKFVHVPHRTWKLHLGVGVGGQNWRESS